MLGAYRGVSPKDLVEKGFHTECEDYLELSKEFIFGHFLLTKTLFWEIFRIEREGNSMIVLLPKTLLKP